MISFQSLSYYLFALVFFLIFNRVKEQNPKKVVLFLINTVFIALLFYFSKKHLVILYGYLFSNYFFLKMIGRQEQRKLLAALQILGSISFLCFFKYELFSAPIIQLMPSLAWFLKPAVFVGVSFFTFKLISVIVDYTSEEIEEKDLDFFHFMNFVSFFPCFLSGPLDRYNSFVSHFEENPPLGAKETYEAIYRIVLGAFKKGVIADSLFELSSAYYHPSEVGILPVSTILKAQYIYTFVLYFDFSGYSDIAIGVSKLFRVKTPENFDNPYMARNIQEFWNKWHISFMHWLRDYIYFPIQKLMISFGIKNFVLMACFAYLFTFILAGVWHGDTIYFFWYGLSHGLAFSLFLLYKKILESNLNRDQLKAYQNNKVIRVMGTLLTYHYFFFSLFFFMNKTEAILKIWGALWT